MTEIDEQGRPEPPADGDEWQTLTGFLDFQRATFAWKTAGLDQAQLGRTIPSSSMTLAGMIKHLALVEEDWFGLQLWGVEWPEPWRSVDWGTDRDWEWRTALDDDPDRLRTLWADAVDQARERAQQAYAEGGSGRLAATTWRDGRTPSLRWILTHMIEEYARHNGHADLLREAIDGQTGE